MDERESERDALLDHAARYRALMESFDGVLISQDGVIRDVNQPLLARSGYAPDELIGRPAEGLRLRADTSRTNVWAGGVWRPS